LSTSATTSAEIDEQVTGLGPLNEYPFHLRPMIVAHRGDTSRGAIENSLRAIAEAMDTGADMVEIDVQQTADEVFICYHDETVLAQDGSATPVHKLTLRELVEGSFRDMSGVDFVPTPLLSVLELTRGKIYLNLEIKEYSNRDPKKFVEALRVLVDRMNMTLQVLLSSFRIDYIREAPWTLPSCIIQPSEGMLQFFASRASLPGSIPTNAATLKPSELMQASRATTYACMLEELDDQRVRDIKSRNLHVSVYTITTDDEFRKAVQLGAKALVCEQPRKFVKLRDSLFHSS
jgi:glycerophosphoryl diester phosphodiesterase